MHELHKNTLSIKRDFYTPEIIWTYIQIVTENISSLEHISYIYPANQMRYMYS